MQSADQNEHSTELQNTSIYQAHPKAYEKIIPMHMESMYLHVLTERRLTLEMKKDTGTNESKNPPDAPIIAENPLLKPENTGTPIIPSKIYKATEQQEILGEYTPAIKNIANVCNVRPTTKGILIQAHIVISATEAETAVKTRMAVDFLNILKLSVFAFIS